MSPLEPSWVTSITSFSNYIGDSCRRLLKRHLSVSCAGFVVRDTNRQARAYVYSRPTEAETYQTKVVTMDEVRRIAVNVARLPDLLGDNSDE